MKLKELLKVLGYPKIIINELYENKGAIASDTIWNGELLENLDFLEENFGELTVLNVTPYNKEGEAILLILVTEVI